MSPRIKLSDEQKADNLIKKNRVQKIKDKENMYMITGQTSIYLVILPNYCSCDHFIFRCIRESGKVCYHIIAARNATNPKEIEDINIMEFFTD